VINESEKCALISEFHNANLIHVTPTCSSARPFLTACCCDKADLGNYEIHSDKTNK